MRRLIFMIMEIKRNIADNHVSAYAAQAAYFIMLSLIPLLILLLSMIQFTGIGKADFYSLIQHLVPQGFQSWMLSIIDEMFSRTVATVSLSAVVTIWSAGKSFMALNRGFNAICRVDKSQLCADAAQRSCLCTVVCGDHHGIAGAGSFW